VEENNGVVYLGYLLFLKAVRMNVNWIEEANDVLGDIARLL